MCGLAGIRLMVHMVQLLDFALRFTVRCVGLMSAVPRPGTAGTSIRRRWPRLRATWTRCLHATALCDGRH